MQKVRTQVKFELKDILKIAGPTAALLFLAWMLFGQLHSRPSDSKQQFEELVQEFRKFDDRYDMGIKKHTRSKSKRSASDIN
jgi:hypothetical protein